MSERGRHDDDENSREERQDQGPLHEDQQHPTTANCPAYPIWSSLPHASLDQDELLTIFPTTSLIIVAPGALCNLPPFLLGFSATTTKEAPAKADPRHRKPLIQEIRHRGPRVLATWGRKGVKGIAYRHTSRASTHFVPPSRPPPYHQRAPRRAAQPRCPASACLCVASSLDPRLASSRMASTSTWST